MDHSGCVDYTVYLFILDRSFLKLAEEDYTGLPNDVSHSSYVAA